MAVEAASPFRWVRVIMAVEMSKTRVRRKGGGPGFRQIGCGFTKWERKSRTLTTTRRIREHAMTSLNFHRDRELSQFGVALAFVLFGAFVALSAAILLFGGNRSGDPAARTPYRSATQPLVDLAARRDAVLPDRPAGRFLNLAPRPPLIRPD